MYILTQVIIKLVKEFIPSVTLNLQTGIIYHHP